MAPSTRSRHTYAAVCPPGLESLCAEELAALGARPRVKGTGVVEFSGGDRVAYAANLWLRTATRVLLRTPPFVARTFDQLTARAGELPWDDWLAGDAVVDLRVTSTASRLWHEGAVVQRLTDLLGTGGAGDDPGRAHQLVVVRLHHDEVMVSIDLSGEPLYKRGWRPDGAKAPLRETLAAALVLASGWDGSGPFLDPFCGSGTIPIEAALVARRLPPGRQRSFAFQRWASFAPGTWASVVGEADTRALPAGGVALAGSDRDAGAVATAADNTAHAGVADDLTWTTRSVSDLERPDSGPGWLVANPPYGRRVGGSDLRPLFQRFGDVARDRFGGWHVALMAPDTGPAHHGRLPLHEAFRTSNGGIHIRALVGRVPAGAPAPGHR